jgi:polar amino acid transport system substrate-binding protein
MCVASTRGSRGTAGLSRAVLLFFLFLATAYLARAGSDPIVFQSTDTPPFWSPSLPDNGLGGAMLQLLSANAGVQYSIEYLPVKRFRNSQATYIVGDPDILVNQKQRAILPIGIFRSAFFYYKPHQDVIEFHSLKDLQGHTLGVLRGTVEDRDLFIRNRINVEESDSVESLLRKLRRGRIDVCILVDAAGKHVIKQMFPAEQAQFATVEIPGSVRPIALMIDVTDPQARLVAQRYQAVLDQTLDSPQYHDILENFYGKGNIPKDRMEQLKKFEQYYATELDTNAAAEK